MLVEIKEKELTAIMAAAFVLRKSREAKNGGTFVENIHEIDTCRRISFYEASGVLDEFIDGVLEGETKYE